MSNGGMLSHKDVAGVLIEARLNDWGPRRLREGIEALLISRWGREAMEECDIQVTVDALAARIVHEEMEIEVDADELDLDPPEGATRGNALFQYELLELLHRSLMEDWGPERLRRQFEDLLLLRWGREALASAEIEVSVDVPYLGATVQTDGLRYVFFEPETGDRELGSVYLTPGTIEVTLEDLVSYKLGELPGD